MTGEGPVQRARVVGDSLAHRKRDIAIPHRSAT